MAYINFKPVCECGHIFKNFIYTPPQQENLIDAEREFVGIRRCDDCFHGLYCPNCGERITDFSIPVFTRDGEIIYKE